MRTPPARVGCLVAAVVCASGLHAAEPPSALALLRGAESARVQADDIRATLTIEYLAPGPSRGLDYLVESSGDRRRFEQFPASPAEGVVVLIDGGEVHGFRRKKNEDVHRYDMSRAVGVRGDTAFDPRILGLSDLMAADATVRACLWYETCDRTEVLGKERVGDVDAWRVRCFSGNTTSDFWIEEPSFRVHRRTIEWPGGRVEISSHFGAGESPFPQRVEIVRDEPNESMRRRVTVKSFETGASIPPERFTLASMDLPMNTPVVDYRISRIVGYWDGEGLSPRPVYAGERPEVRTPALAPPGAAPVRPWLIVANVVVVLGVLVFLWRRRRAAA